MLASLLWRRGAKNLIGGAKNRPAPSPCLCPCVRVFVSVFECVFVCTLARILRSVDIKDRCLFVLTNGVAIHQSEEQ